MFQALISQQRSDRGVSHPALSFALHAGAIAVLVAAGRPASAPPMADPGRVEEVIYVPDVPRTSGQVEEGPVVARAPACSCDQPIGLPALPGGDISSPLRMPAPGDLVGLPGRQPDGGIEVDGAVSGLYAEADLSESPEALQFVPPVYPEGLKAAGIQGRVQVRYVVDAGGRVETGSIIVVSSDHPAMTASVRRSLEQARFRPGKLGGTPVRTLVQQTYRFSLMSL